jgi:hypothetical protein
MGRSRAESGAAGWEVGSVRDIGGDGAEEGGGAELGRRATEMKNEEGTEGRALGAQGETLGAFHGSASSRMRLDSIAPNHARAQRTQVHRTNDKWSMHAQTTWTAQRKRTYQV